MTSSWSTTSTAVELRELLMELVSLLGLTLEAAKTPEPSPTMEILGVTVALSMFRTPPGLTLRASFSVGPAKRILWAHHIQQVLDAGCVQYGELEQLVGRLSFASSAAWGPLARGHLASLFALLARGGGSIPVAPACTAAFDLAWWRAWLLEARTVDIIPRSVDLPLAVVYTDAEGHGGIGGVLLLDASRESFAGRVPPELAKRLKPRRTQIFPFEVLAGVAALIKWGSLLCGRRVAFFIDNFAARGSLASGRSSQVDVNGIVGAAWQLVARYGISIFFIWVPSSLNIADFPSRRAHVPCTVRVPLDIRWEVVYKSLDAVEASVQ